MQNRIDPILSNTYKTALFLHDSASKTPPPGYTLAAHFSLNRRTPCKAIHESHGAG